MTQEPDNTGDEHQAGIHRKPTILVLGGHGFIGRHVVSELHHIGVRVLIGTRKKTESLNSFEERVIVLQNLTSDPCWENKLRDVDVIINTVGILRQRWAETYEQVHHQAVAKLANFCSKKSIRFIHISALGLNNQIRSRFLKSKRLGEQAVMQSGADWHIVRPSLVDGDGGYGARWFRAVAKWPIHIVPNNALGMLAPIKAAALGMAIATIALDKRGISSRRHADRIYELGGSSRFSLIQYLTKLRPREYRANSVCIKVPALLARLLSHVCDAFHLTPFSFGHYELLKFDNCPNHNRLPELLTRHALTYSSK